MIWHVPERKLLLTHPLENPVSLPRIGHKESSKFVAKYALATPSDAFRELFRFLSCYVSLPNDFIFSRSGVCWTQTSCAMSQSSPATTKDVCVGLIITPNTGYM
jgi:hypothetical protein